ncbi:MAG: DUF2752 domain-containing protein [Candidatus Symbiothrix sp.]|nr:DUF2752 domain-containing protein [Candidatus Symbiothrix sp.]
MTKRNLYIFVFVASLVGYVWVILNIFHIAPIYIGCLFHKITHIPCPSCGSTHSVIALLNGDFAGAFYANPFGFVVCAALALLPLWLLFDCICRKDSFFRFYKNMEARLKKRYIAIPALVLVIINWIWNIYKYL